MTMDVTKLIQAKSDQQNAEDYIAGPRTIKIRDVVLNGAAEQKISVFFEGDDNKPWKPCKSAARCLAAIWGADASKWIGLSCTIYCDPTVTWGGAAVGGIRVSHMEGLDRPRPLMLSKARGKKAAVTIHPLKVDKVTETAPTPEPTPTPETTLNTATLDAEIEAAKAMTPEDKAAWWKTKTKPERDYITAKSKAA